MEVRRRWSVSIVLISQFIEICIFFRRWSHIKHLLEEGILTTNRTFDDKGFVSFKQLEKDQDFEEKVVSKLQKAKNGCNKT